MLKVVSDRSLFDSDCEYLTNTINTVGAMGAGLALEYRMRIPEMYEIYRQLCDQGQIQIGRYWIYDRPNRMHRKILNFPVKRGFNHPSKWEYVMAGLRYFVDNYAKDDVRSIAMPTLGARLGKLDEDAVLIVMEEELSDLPIDVEIYLHRSQDNFTRTVKNLVNRLTVSELARGLQMPLSRAELIKTRVDRVNFLSDLVVFDKMSVNLVQKLYDFGFANLNNERLPQFVG